MGLCGDSYRIMIIKEKICKQCNSVFHKPYNESIKNWLLRHVFCSKKCYSFWMVGKDPFKNKQKKKYDVWNKGKNFPERSGFNNPSFSRIVINCLECEAPFTIKKYRKEIAKFCSHQCASKNRNYGKTPKNESIRHSAAYKSWRTLVFERDNYTCVFCKVVGGLLHADHIKPFAFFPDLHFDISNGRTLCKPCHLKTHTYGNRKLVATEA